MVWEEYCRREGVPATEAWYAEIQAYEAKALSQRPWTCRAGATRIWTKMTVIRPHREATEKVA